MSVLIKGMKMPSDCMSCELEEFYEFANSYRCPLIYKGYTSKIRQDGKLPKCPLVEIPERHGRLVDADKLMAIFSDRLERVAKRYGIDSSEAGILSGAMELLESQMTIIEAEGVEE